MRKINKLAAAIAVAVGVGAVSAANAEIVLKHNGLGDTLLFPAFQGDVENYFTIMNNSNTEWIQGHLRFRGAAWSGELLDFDVILSPGDVFVFRLADIDGDGYWEIDQSLDPKNFEYTGMLQNCTAEKDPIGVAENKTQCMDQSAVLIPPVGGVITQGLIDYHRQQGYVEFIGEGVLVPPLGTTMRAHIETLINPANAGKFRAAGQRNVGNKLGTHLWSWTHAYEQWNGDFGAYDVPNVLSGTAFITVPGSHHGLAYNAEAFVDFRTGVTDHRIDNYRILNGNTVGTVPAGAPDGSDNRAVIIHDENGARVSGVNVSGAAQGTSPWGDYVYGWPYVGEVCKGGIPDDRKDEAMVSFNNTWGPTLADGDDYDLSNLRWTVGVDDSINFGIDDWDRYMSALVFGGKLNEDINSVAEVEEAIRAGGQTFSSFYFDSMGRQNLATNPSSFDGGVTAIFDAACQGNGRESSGGQAFASGMCSTMPITSWYYSFFPTKFFYGQQSNYYLTCPQGLSSYIRAAVTDLVSRAKPIGVAVWDILENTPTPLVPECPQSPCPVLVEETGNIALAQEVTFFPIGYLKGVYSSSALASNDYSKGRVVITPINNNPFLNGGNPIATPDWPFLNYTFEMDDEMALSHWRSMHR